MHKFKSFVLIGGTLILAASSCAPVYRCGDRIPDKLPGGKRLKAVVIERDELCTNLAMSQSENADLTARLNESIQNNQTLRQEFDNLRLTLSLLSWTPFNLNTALGEKRTKRPFFLYMGRGEA